MADINVIISDQTQVTSQEGFGKLLVVCTTTAHSYEEYDISEDLASVQVDFATDTEVYKIVNTFASQEPRPQKVAIFGTDISASQDKAADLTTALNTLITQYPNWYRIILDDKTETLIAAVATWSETNNKRFYTQFDNTTFTTDFTSKKRTALGYKKNTDRLDAAMVGYAATRIPGSFTFKFKNLKNITADAILPADLATIRSKNMNAYVNKFEVIGLGTAQLDSGVTASGDYIDHIESMDWVKFQIESEIAKLLMATEKVPYTDAGIQQVVSAITTALQSAFNNGIIGTNEDNTPAFSITYKTVREIPSTDRQNRKLTGIKFNYVEAGAIEEVTVNGAVVLEL